jgi:transposase
MTTWAGIDVAKDTHWICALNEAGRVVLSRAVRNTQAELDALSAELRALPGPVTVGLDVDGSIATFLQAVLLSDGLALVHVPGLSVNRAAHGFAGGERKSDPQDARVIADLVRTREGLRPIRPDDDATAALRLLVSRRRDLVQDQNRRFSRLRQLLSQAHPALEAALDVTAKGPLVLLTRYVTPAEIRAASEKAIVRHLRRTPNLRHPEALAATARACAAEQRIAVPGEATIARLVKEAAAEALLTRQKLIDLDKELEAIVAVHPKAALVRSLPGMGAVLTAEFIAAAGDLARFRSPAALAAAAGLAPVLRQSGHSRTLRRARRGDRDLKRILYQSAFSAFASHPESRAYYDRKRREGKHHVQAIIALARQRTNVLWAIIAHNTPYNPNHRTA